MRDRHVGLSEQRVDYHTNITSDLYLALQPVPHSCYTAPCVAGHKAQHFWDIYGMVGAPAQLHHQSVL